MLGLQTWELVMLAVAMLIAGGTLVRLMLARRDALIAEIREQFAAQATRRKKKNKNNDAA